MHAAVTAATLDRWLFLWRTGQDLAAQLGKPGPTRCWNEAALARLQTQVAADPDARLGDHVRAWQKAGGQEALQAAIACGLATVTTQDAQGFFAHCGYPLASQLI